MLKLFSLIFAIFVFGCTPVSASAEAVSTPDPMTTDPRHVLVKKVRADFAADITARQAALTTTNSALALVDIAREYLERGLSLPSDYNPSHPNWALLINHVLCGYGYDRGVAETLVVTEPEELVLSKAHAFSSAYLNAVGQEPAILDGSIYGNPAEVLAIVATLNRLAASVPEELNEFARANVARLGGLAQLRGINAWFAHERFWAVGGVLDPKTPGQLRTAFRAFTGTPFAFVTDLTTKLDHAIRGMAADPTAQSVVDLVQLSQQVLMTLAAGTPGDADAWVRLNPSNAGEWEIIRKAMFLALSVTSNPESAGRTFLSTLYDCGSYYPKKTDVDDAKAYYWRLEAFANDFSTIWQCLKETKADAAIQALLAGVIVQANPGVEHEKFVVDVNRTRVASGQGAHAFKVERSPNHGVLMGAYDASIRAITLGTTRTELTASLALHPKLKHDQTFRALYPDLINWVTYHEPSPRARTLVSGAVTRLSVPGGFTPQGIQLLYQGGKWALKALQLDIAGNTSGEAILWRQGASATETLVSELTNSQGLHLFSFAVNGTAATIKAISSSYITKVGGEGATVVVAHGQEVGVMESSAYPWEVDTVAPENTSAISINAVSYNGSRGALVSSRGSVWVNAPSIDTLYWQGFEVRQHNSKPYNFFSPKGQGFEASKNLVLQGKNVVAQFSILTAGQNIRLLYHPSANTSELKTHGSYIKAGNEVEIDHNDWWGDTQTVFAGTDGSSRWQNQADLVPNSARAVIEFGRFFKYIAWNVYFLNEEERKALASGQHVYGTYLNFGERMPRFQIIVQRYTEVPSSGGGGYRRGYGGGGYGYGFGHTVGDSRWGVSSMRESTVLSRPSLAAAPSSLSVAGFEFGASMRGGVSSVVGSVTLSSMMGGMQAGGVTLGFDFRSGDGGRSLDLQSTYTPTSLAEFVRLGARGVDPMQTSSALSMHMAASAMILQVTAPRVLHADKVIRGAIFAVDKLEKLYQAAKLATTPLRTIGTLGDPSQLLKDAPGDSKGDAKSEKKDGAGSAAGTGGPLPDPEDDGREKEKKPTSINQMQQLVERDKAPGIARFDKADPAIPGSKDHVHFKDGTSMNIDGTIHDKLKGIPNITKKTAEFLLEHGWPSTLSGI